MPSSPYYAVLTGDIIKSGRLSRAKLESVRASLLKNAGAVRGWKRGLIKGRPEFFRGDAWQLLLTDPGMAMRCAVFLRACFLSQGLADSRIAIGVGETEKISTSRVSLSTGEAFVLSGHALDKMTGYYSLEVAAPGSVGPLAEWLALAGHLCDSLIRQWTERQAEIVRIAVHPNSPTHEQIARKVRPAVTKQAVSKALRGANWHVVRETVRRFEQTPWNAVLSS